MHPRTSTDQTAPQGDHPTPTGPDSPPPDGASPARRQGLDLGATLARTLAHFWPDFREWLAEVTDTRDQQKITYAAPFLLMMGLMLYLLKLGARRQLRFELDSPEMLVNLNRLSGCRQEAIAHSDTVNHGLGHVPPPALRCLRRKMVQRLLRMKALLRSRLFGHYLIVLDGTGQLFFRQRHCPHCLTKTVDGVTQYYHHVLEAKLVTPEGLAISIASEFIENHDPKATKQDCELKAFRRLAEHLKQDFPQLRICLLLDGLYANGTVFDLCQQYHWKYIVTFKQGSLPALWQDYQGLLALAPENRRAAKTTDGRQQTFAWAEALEHVDQEKRKHRVNAFQCLERDRDGEHFFAWLTNCSVSSDTVVPLANRGGRCRWKIENEGFNIQKNGGFNLEHAYSTGERQIKNFYLLLQIAHMILQLIERGNLLSDRCQHLFGSLLKMAHRLAESLRNRLIPLETLDPETARRIQIRLDSS